MQRTSSVEKEKEKTGAGKGVDRGKKGEERVKNTVSHTRTDVRKKSTREERTIK